MSGMGWDDERGVSEVLGAMLLFGIVVMAIGGYQAFIVPQQNAEIEQKHDAQVSDEFVEVQSAISNAASTGTTRTTSVTLGTQYPVRAAGLNPPTVSGQLATEADGEISASGIEDYSLNNTCGLSPETRAITYRANYNEFDDAGTLAYENGVTYRHASDSVLVRNEQELVDGSTIRLFPLVGDGFATSTSSTKQIRFVPGETGTQTVDTEGDNLTLSFPSRLGEKSWRDEILEDRNDVTVDKSGGEVTLTFDPGTYTIQCTPVGLGSKPANQGPVPEEREDSATNEVNPVGEGAVTFKSAEVHEERNNIVNITLENRGDVERKVEEIRVPFYVRDSQGTGDTPAKRVNVTGGQDPDRQVGGNYETAQYLIDDEGEILISFFCGNGDGYPVGSGDFFAVNALFKNGDTASYYITVPEGGSSEKACSANENPGS